eukprot:TRINITY_DN39396_c0_g1_i1.p2 TRINITY_DN39396_c0_g1~~TRINITY_DN39396_c0_g1_i1.p2  ORF type:complete len:306 (+),score=72.72 TRINITY_DN39396_c0_g1_i1:88-1005(+)
MCLNFALSAGTLTYKKLSSLAHDTKKFLDRLPLESFVCGCTAGVAGRAATITVMPPPAMWTQMQTLYRFAPLWGMRFGLYTAAMSGRAQGREDAHPLSLAPWFAFSGALAEFWTRFFSNPINRVRYTRDLRAAASKEAVSFPGQALHLWSTRGMIGFVEGSPSYRVEMTYMALLFAVFNTARNTVISMTGEQPNMLYIPLNAACGAAGAFVATSVTHSMRASVAEDQTLRAKSYYIARPRAEMLRGQVALCAVTFGLYTALMQVLCPITDVSVPQQGFGGWEPAEVELNEYGGEKGKEQRKLTVL